MLRHGALAERCFRGFSTGYSVVDDVDAFEVLTQRQGLPATQALLRLAPEWLALTWPHEPREFETLFFPEDHHVLPRQRMGRAFPHQRVEGCLAFDLRLAHFV